MKSSSPSFLPFALAAVALVVSGFALWQQPVAAGPLASPAKSQDLIDVQRRLAALEAREPAVALRADPGAATSVQRAAVPDPRLDDLLRRVAQLEAQRAQPTSERRPTPLEEAQAEAERLQRRAARDAERAAGAAPARDKILDPRASESDKLAAWSVLRDAGPDAWTDAVVAEMARIGLTSPSAQVRADVWRQADARARSERLVPSLMQALVHDVDASTREEAAETLANYLDSPGVRAALEAAAANDADPNVKREALGSLSGR